jgi:GT2 family glycosyltransferase
MSHPVIAVLIPHYNDLDGLYKSLASISAVEPVDVFIVDDGSPVRPLLSDLKKKFPSIHEISVTYLDENKGDQYARNIALRMIHDSKKYRYIANLDAGDTCAPERFKIQREFLDQNEDIFVVGSWANMIDENGILKFIYKLPLSHKQIKRDCYIRDMFVHGSVMFRANAIDAVGYYPLDYKYCNDTVYFYRFITHFETANLGLLLYNYIINPRGISQSNYRKQKWERIRFSLATFTFVYPFAWLTGMAKNVVCFILGPKISLTIAYKLYRSK